MPNRFVIYALFIGITVVFSSAIGISFTPGEWYASLSKPPFNPPGWVFGPVWTALYVCIAIVGARLYLKDKRSALMTLWIVQMLLNWSWTPLFFGMQQPPLALIIIMLLLGVIMRFITNAWQADRISAYLFLPYALWVGFATILNASIVYLNS